MLDCLFVYGTLRSEFNSHYARLLRQSATLVGRTTLPGSIFHVGHFPAFRPEPRGVVHGELYRLRNTETILQALDDYEGEEFERVALGDVWIYQYKIQPPESSRIVSGDFCAR